MNTAEREGFDAVRRIHRILTLHFVEGMKQIDIAAEMKLSVASVNRLIKQGRDMGMVEISIRSPFDSSFLLSARLKEATGLREAVVAPCPSDDDGQRLRAAGKAAASLLLDNIRDGQTICISGGKGVSALVEALDAERAFDVMVVPATGGVQGKHYTDVNHLASEMALKLGGRARQIHVPMFASSPEERDALMSVISCVEALNLARRADVAVVGIGSIHAEGSSYFDLNSEVRGDAPAIAASGSETELLAHLLDRSGTPTRYRLNRHLVGMTPEELKAVPFSIGVSAGSAKALPVASVLRGRYLKALVTDEATAEAVLSHLSPEESA